MVLVWAGTQNKKRLSNSGQAPRTKNGRNHLARNLGRSRDFIESITLYDQRNKKIGNIYPRRAKQLVLKGRASWLDEGSSLQIVSNITDSSSTTIKEEKAVIDDNVFQSNNRPKAAMSDPGEADVLLMYQAKQNVKDRKNLIRHVIAFLAAWPVLAIFHNSASGVHPRWWDISQNLNHVIEFIPEEYAWVLNDIEWFFFSRYTPEIWYVFLGAVLAWGGWLALRIAKRVVKRFRTSSKVKPDPVLQEYNRLKGMASDAATLFGETY